MASTGLTNKTFTGLSKKKTFKGLTKKKTPTALARGHAGQTVMSPVFKLPLEILLEISQVLSVHDHNNLSRTCRYLTSALQSYLFRRNWSASGDKNIGALNYACETGNLATIQRSLAFGLPPHVDDTIPAAGTDRRITPVEADAKKSLLGLATFYVQGDLVLHLLRELGADPNKQGPYGATPLGIASYRLSSYSDEGYWNFRGFLKRASGKRVLRVIEALLDSGASADCKVPGILDDDYYDDEKATAATIVTSFSRRCAATQRLRPYATRVPQILRKMLRAGADPNIRSRHRCSITGWVFANFHEAGQDLADLVLEKGGYMDYRSPVHPVHTALGAAIEHGRNPEVAIKYLASRRASLDPGPQSRCSPLSDAIKYAKPDAVFAMLRLGVNANVPVNLAGGQHCTLLGLVVSRPWFGNLAVWRSLVEDLLKHGADPSEPSGRGGRSALAFAMAIRKPIWCGDDVERCRVVEMLVRYGADVNRTPFDGPDGVWTPLVSSFVHSKEDTYLAKYYHALKRLYKARVKTLNGQGNGPVGSEDRVALAGVMNSTDMLRYCGIVRVLVKAGARVSRADLDLIKQRTTLRKQISRW